MKYIAASIAISALAATAVEAQEERRKIAPPAVYDVAPGLGHFTDDVLFGEVWERTELPSRDRSLVTLSAIVSTGKTAQIGAHVSRALDNGVKPGEIGELITHLAFYSGWPNAISAVTETKKVFDERQIAPVKNSEAARIELKPQPRRLGARRSAPRLHQRRQHWPTLPTACSSAICGSARICRRATVAW